MSAIHTKSLTGITSITTPPGVDNVFTVHSNDTTERFRVDQSGNQNISGIVTASNFKTGVSNLHNLGLTLSNGQLDIGSNIKAGNAGVITATAFHGSGANLTGISGFATALSNTPNTFLNDCFKTTFSHTIPNGTQIDITNNETTSGKTVFTRLGQIKVATGATFHVSAGTTFVMDVLGVF